MSMAIYGTLVAAKIYAPGHQAEQMVLSLWGIITFLLWLCTFNSNVSLSSLFFTLSLLFWFIAGGLDHPNGFLKFAGIWGFIVAAIAFYTGTAALMEDVYGREILPVFPLGKTRAERNAKLAAMKAAKSMNRTDVMDV